MVIMADNGSTDGAPEEALERYPNVRLLRTGANLVTINLTPPDIRGDYLLYKRDRFIMTEERILSAIAAEGLAPSSQSLADFYRAEKRVNGTSRKSKQTETAMAK